MSKSTVDTVRNNLPSFGDGKPSGGLVLAGGTVAVISVVAVVWVVWTIVSTVVGFLFGMLPLVLILAALYAGYKIIS